MKTVEKSKTELVPLTFQALAVPATQMAEVLRANAGQQGITPFDLDRVKVPAGGGTSWEVPTLKGTQSAPAVLGVVIFWKDVRSYWDSAFTGQNNPPVCTSLDGMVGIGKPGGLCLKCPLAQFGTAQHNGKAGRGQACKQARMLFVLRPEDRLPLLVVLSPTSLKASKQYFLRLAGAGKSYYSVVTQISLAKTKNADGIAYSQAEFMYVRDLDPQEQENAVMVAQAMKSIFETQTVLEADVRGTE